MGTYKRLPREKEKPVNEIGTWLDHAHHWFNVNWKIILTGIVSAIGLTCLILIISYFSANKDEKAKVLFYNAEKVAVQNVDSAVTAFEDLIKKYPRAEVSTVARLRLGDIYFSKADYDKALDVLAPVAKNSNPLFRVLGLNNIAASKLAKGDAAGSAETYLKAYSDSKNQAKGFSYFNAGLAYVRAGKIDEAKKIFADLSKDDSDLSTPDLKEKSKEQLIWLSLNK